ncbi:MAG: hypothetical protein F6K30_23715 [Cyanothece sp. SIO2G6]|nr:hypothetical protein [Cyanothece sp. SIO2G6]
MSQQNNFLGGFVLGTLVGGFVGGIAGVLVSSRLPDQDNDTDAEVLEDPTQEDKRLSSERNMEEVSRRSLEDKIAQLNDAIDDVRQQLSTVNERTTTETNGEQVLQEF